MEIFSFYNLVSSAFLLLFGAFISIIVGRGFGISLIRSLILYSWHSLFCLIYLWYVSRAGGDANSYYIEGTVWNGEVGVGTQAIRALSGVLVSGLGLSMLATFLFFNILGQIGMLAFWGSLKQATAGKDKKVRFLATLIVFLPSVSFWSSALGKDAISFMATGLALWSSLNLSKRGFLMAFAVGAMFVVRPHMAGIMVLAITVAAFMDANASVLRRVMIGLSSVGIASFLLPFAIRYAGIGDVVDLQSISGYIEKRQSYNTEGGGGVDIASMSLPMQLFTYFFRPLLFEVRSFFALAASIDNLVLLLLLLLGGIGFVRKESVSGGESHIFMWTYMIASWVVLAITTANLGIALRQKWMFAPMFVYLFISVIGKKDRKLAAPIPRYKEVDEDH